jgi:hypothetical protein
MTDLHNTQLAFVDRAQNRFCAHSIQLAIFRNRSMSSFASSAATLFFRDDLGQSLAEEREVFAPYTPVHFSLLWSILL